MVIIRETTCLEHIDAISALTAENWDETGYDFPLVLDVDFYKQLEALGMIIAIAAFEGEQVVGYSLASITSHPFNRSIILCNSSALFLRKAYRGSAGARLMLETERVAKARGAQRMLWNTRSGSPLHATLTKRGYTEADTVMMKEL